MDNRLVYGKLMRRGRTTGACAAAAAKGAAYMLISKKLCDRVTVNTPSGIELAMDLSQISIAPDYAYCAVQKDSGDDPDVTNGCFVCACVSYGEKGIEIRGGEGIGRVTKPGLDQPVGEYAINTVPRRMIEAECKAVCEKLGYGGGLSVEISIPGGKELSARTFNPRMGITGGLSILGTTGIVEPMSQKAVADTIRGEFNLLYQTGCREAVLAIGNYGVSFLREHLGIIAHIKCGNFIGEALAAATEKGFSSVLLAGHIGKIVKLGIGITNTHSSHGDGRMETLMACCLEAGADIHILRQIGRCATTDAAIDIIEECGLLEEAMSLLKLRIEDTLNRHINGKIKIKLVCFRGLSENMKELFSICV